MTRRLTKEERLAEAARVINANKERQRALEAAAAAQQKKDAIEMGQKQLEEAEKERKREKKRAVRKRVWEEMKEKKRKRKFTMQPALTENDRVSLLAGAKGYNEIHIF